MSERAVRTYRLEIAKPTAEQRERWDELAEACTTLKNRFWRVWEQHHHAAGNPAKLRQWLADLKAWHEAGKAKQPRGDKPKSPCQAIDSECAKAIYGELTAVNEHLHVRTVTLVQNKLGKTLKSRKSIRGSLSGWIRILLDEESRPAYVRGATIPFDKANAIILPPVKGADKDQPEGNWRMAFRIWRVPVPGQKNAESIQDVVQLRTAGRRRANAAKVLRKCHEGEWEFAGSELVRDDRSGKWFVVLAYQLPKESPGELDANATLIVRPGYSTCWQVRLPGGRRYFVAGNRGHHIEERRKKLLLERRARQHNYRLTGSSTKGHGMRRALDGVLRLSQRWRSFVTNANDQTTRQLVDFARQNKIGRIVVIEPRNLQARFLAQAGKVPDLNDSTGWDFSQFSSKMAYKCEADGIVFERRQGKQRLRAEGLAAGRV